MNEAVDRVIEQREAMDRGFPAGVVLSVGLHLVLVGAAFGAAWLGPPTPKLRVADGIAVPLPPGGGGPLEPAPAPAAGPPKAAAPEPVPPPPAPEPPPKEEPGKGLARPDAKKHARPEPTPPPARRPEPGPPDARGRASTGAAGGTGTSSATPGLGLVGPAGPGVPTGTDALGDWYLASVQRKIWILWTRQVKTGFTQPITVTFTILADGTLEDGSVRVVQSSGVQLLDNAALRAVFSAGPFAPLPKAYGTNRYPIQALFQPTP